MCYKPTRLYIILETSLTFEFFLKYTILGQNSVMSTHLSSTLDIDISLKMITTRTLPNPTK